MKTIYEDMGLQRVINACGRMTALGVSAIHNEVAEVLVKAAQNYVVIDELMDKTGELISIYTGGEDACVTVCASAGIMIAAAACIAGDNWNCIKKLPDSTGMKNEILIQKGHAVNFGASITQMLRMGGAVPVECGQVNLVTREELETAVTEQTAALLYCKSHHCMQKGMLSVEVMAEIAHNHGLPLIVDAAAEEDLHVYLNKGADLVIYSGAKAFEGPTSGFITGRADLIKKCKMQYHGVGRVAKIGKEGMTGLVKALELYSKKDEKREQKRQQELVGKILEDLKEFPFIQGEMSRDDAQRLIYRAKMKFSPDSPMTAQTVMEKLKEGNPAVYVRGHEAQGGVLYIDPRSISEEDVKSIINKLRAVLKEDAQDKGE